MEVEAIALDHFVHGDINAVAGHVVRRRSGALIDEALARDLERVGLVRLRVAQTVPRTVKPVDDGQGQPSSASEAAPVSPMTTSSTFPSGKRRGRPPKSSS